MPDISINRKTYIKIGNASPIATGIAEGSLLIDRVLFAQDFAFGQFASSRMEVQIYDISNVAGQKVRVYQVENEGEQNEVTTDLYNGQIESSKLDNAGYYRDIIAYDMLYFIAKKNVADWFNGLWTNNTTQISVLQAFQSLLTYFNIQSDSTTVNAQNFSGTLYKDSVVAFEKISFKDMVKYLLEPLALIPYIGADGKCYVYAPSMADEVELSSYDKNQSVFEEYTTLPMQWVGIANVDSSILGQQEISGNTSDIRYDLPYNPIRLDLFEEDATSARTAVLTDFVSKANFDEYTPCEVPMIVSDMSIKLGDIITTTHGSSYVSEMVLSGPMLVEQQLISRGSPIQQEVEEEYDPVFSYLDNRITETAEDLQDQLDDFEPSAEYLAKVGEFSDTIAGGMGLKVITYTAQDGSVLKYFYAPPPAGSQVTGISGSNFIFTMKSTGFAWTNKWEGTADASSESHVDPSTQQQVSTQWTSGISANGNAILKILNAYKISADWIEGGTLQITDGNGNVIHEFSNVDGSMDIGGGYDEGGISYDSTNGLRIASDVIIGAATDAAQDIVDSLDIKAIDHQEVKYQAGSSATTIPSGTWLNSPPSVSAGQYLWTRTVTYYTDGTDTSSDPAYSVARQGSDGSPGSPGAAGTGISSTTISYQIGSSSTTVPTGSWSSNPPDISSSGGNYLWTKVHYTYTDNTTKDAYSVAYIATDGQPGGTGPTGRGLQSIEHQYYLSSSNSSLANGSWSSTPATYVSGYYYWERYKMTWTSGTSPTYSPGENGVLCKGLNKAILDANEANTAIGNWCYDNNTTYIDGGKIYAGSITAEKIAANAITSNKIAAGAITADKLSADSAMFNKIFTYDGEVENSIASQRKVIENDYEWSGYLYSSTSYTTIATGISLLSGVQYKITFERNDSSNSNPFLELLSGSQILTRLTISSGTVGTVTTYSPASNYSNVSLRINPYSSTIGIGYTVKIEDDLPAQLELDFDEPSIKARRVYTAGDPSTIITSKLSPTGFSSATNDSTLPKANLFHTGVEVSQGNSTSLYSVRADIKSTLNVAGNTTLGGNLTVAGAISSSPTQVSKARCTNGAGWDLNNNDATGWAISLDPGTYLFDIAIEANFSGTVSSTGYVCTYFSTENFQNNKTNPTDRFTSAYNHNTNPMYKRVILDGDNYCNISTSFHVKVAATTTYYCYFNNRSGSACKWFADINYLQI